MLFAALLVVSTPPTLVFGGDVMLNGIAPARKPLAELAPIFQKADAAIVNLEIPLTNSTTRTTRKTAAEIKRRDQYVLKADPGHMAHLKAVGIDMVGLANNHALDYGPKGLDEMIRALDKAGIAHTGAGRNSAAAERVAVIRRGKTRIGLVSYLAFVSVGGLRKCTPATEKSAGVAVLSFGGKPNVTKIRSIVQNARASCDVLVVALHWGIEKQTRPSGYQRALGQAFIDAGADVVWGHHPHVLQPAETYKRKPIMYSMGNLVSPRPGKSAVAFWRVGTESVTLKPYNIRGGRVTFK
ncbi:CapA family protein [bacterium]|nr:MAG: CapA family protein [bacterium]